VIGLIIGGIFFFASQALKNAADEDFYELGNDRVPSVKYILGEVRDVSGVSTSVSGTTSTKIIEYSVSTNQREEMQKYALALMDDHGFYNTTAYDFSGPTGRGFDFTKESRESGYIVIVTIEYDRSGYTISIVRARGTLTIPDPDDDPAINVDPTPLLPTTPDPPPTPSPTPGTDPTPPGQISDHPLVGEWELVFGVELWFFAESEFIRFTEEANGTFRVYESDYGEEGTWEINEIGMLVVEGDITGTHVFFYTIEGDLLTLVDEDGDAAVYRRNNLG